MVIARYSTFNCIGHSIESRSCVFQNLCYTKSKWYFYQDENLVTQLPADTLIDPIGEVTHDVLFPDDWGINLATSYPHERVEYEHKVTKNTFRQPIIQDYPIPNATWIESPIFLFVRTQNDENAGHLVYDTYFPLLTTIATHLGNVKYSENVTTVDYIYRGDSFAFKQAKRSDKNSKYETGWKINIGSKLFQDQLTQREFRIRNNKITGLVCYETVLIGCGRLSGLQGNTVHYHAGSMQYLREKMWKKYADSDNPVTASTIPDVWNVSSTMSMRNALSHKHVSDTPVTASMIPDVWNFSSTMLMRNALSHKRVKVLMLEKVTSYWRQAHTNFINNWSGVVSAVKAINHTSVVSVIPHKLSFGHQIDYYKQADIVISLWGGISMLNFLIPAGGVEILISSWFAPLMPLPINSESTVLVCPDFDAIARNSLSENNVLKFCTRTNGTSGTNVNIHNFVDLVKRAVKHVLYKNKITYFSKYV